MATEKKEKSIFDEFTGKYSLSKTLRFELRPVGKTLENMRQHLGYDKNLQTFLADQKIEDAYQSLKPIFDFLHEKFITESLESDVARKIDFTEYFEKYKRRKDLSEKDFVGVEKSLRDEFLKAYDETAESLRIKAGKNEKGKFILSENGHKILTEHGILEYIKKNIDEFVEITPEREIEKSLAAFEGFFTYFGGFNQNRENYYETKKETATSVATRVIHENLPKFCDNILAFDGRSRDYKNAYSILQKLGRTLVDKEGKELIPIEENISKIEYFNSCMSQRGVEKYNDQIGNANFLINLYNQAKKEENGFKKLPLLKTLYRQIGCGEKRSLFFAINYDQADECKKQEDNTEIRSLEEVLNLANKAGKKYFKGKSDDGMINTLPEFLEYLKNRENYLGVYWSKTALNTISSKYFTNWHTLKERLKEAKVFKKAGKDSEEEIMIPEAVELEGFFSVLDVVENWKDEGVLFKQNLTEAQKGAQGEDKNKARKDIILNASIPSEALLNLIFLGIEQHAKAFLDRAPEVLALKEYKNATSKEVIKSWMDHALSITQMLKYFLVKESKVKGTALDSTISQALEVFLQSDDADWFGWYDALRNYLTKKPQDDLKENKLKLNFENSTLASGWDVSKEPDNYCVIFQNPEGEKFLAIIARKKDRKGFNKIFEKNNHNRLYTVSGNKNWKKIEYKLLPGPNKMLPKCLMPKSDRFKYGATQEILDIYDEGSFKKNEVSFSIQKLYKMIDFYKMALERYKDWGGFNFSFQETSKYQDISQFYNDVEKQGYKLDVVDINKSIVDSLVEDGSIYLFEIKNQDSNQGKKENHRDNLHTIYWRAVFESVENRPKLNGGAEIFYRKALLPEKLERNEDRKGKKIIKNPRFSKEKFLFHVPITLNFSSKNTRINDLVNDILSRYGDVHFLGIDRGEKHLAYYSLVDQNGRIKDHGTLNIPFLDKDGNSRMVRAKKRTLGKDGKEQIEMVECKDYNELLDARAGDRDYARKNWQTIGTIKDLKDGYISQVVRTIADLALANNAFIVLESLDTGFKRGRQKIEKSVYQKLELALAKKLNFLVDKKAKFGEIGSVTNALQLTPPVANYGDIENRKQLGVMLYVKADYTSQTDPITGWRKSIYLKKGSEEYIRSQIRDGFSDISFDGKDYVFTYEDKNTHKQWKLYSGKNGKSLDRYHREKGETRNSWDPIRKDVTEMLNGIFENFNRSNSIHSQIVDEGVELKKIDSAHTAWESLRFTIDLIQQIRNTGTAKEDDDFILSPVRDENGNHFDSRKTIKYQPNSGDANGAYNIARKGIIANEHIKRGYRLFISDEEWDAWLAGKERWEKWISDHKKDLVKKQTAQ